MWKLKALPSLRQTISLDRTDSAESLPKIAVPKHKMELLLIVVKIVKFYSNPDFV